MVPRNFLALILVFLTATASFAQGPSVPPAFSHNPGIYSNPFQLSITHPEGGVVIRYTTNGSEPTASSPVFGGPIQIADRTDAPNVFSRIRTTPQGASGMGLISWTEPLGPVAKGTVIRAAAFRDGHASETVSGSFFVFPEGSPYRSLPLVSIIVDSLSFFGHNEGIYVAGANFSAGNNASGNYYMRGDEWEREGNFEFFGRDGRAVISQTAGYRIHGSWTRRFPQKSLRVYARGRYGANTFDFNGRLFHYRPHTSFRRLILRAGGNDIERALMRDAATQYMVSHLTSVGTQSFRSVTVFLNGEFWGWHNIRERYDQHYLSRHYGVNPDSVDMLDFHSGNRGAGRPTVEADPGDTLAYSRMAAFARNNNLAEAAAMDSMLKLIDIDSYLDFYAIQMIFGNADGVYHNHKMWRERREFNRHAPAYRDGRFRWLVVDLDQTMQIWGSTANEPTFSQIFNRSLPGNELFLNLMDNETVRRSFINRFPDMLNTALTSERTTAIIDSIAGTMRPVMGSQIRRWRIPGWIDHSSTGYWEEEVTRLRETFRSRPDAVRSMVRSHFDAGSDRTVTLTTDTAHGFIKINSMVVDPRLPGTSSQVYPWSGRYFANVPITLRGAGKPFYRIEEWIVNGTRFTDSVLTVSLSAEGPYRIEAVFVYDETYVNVAHRGASRGRPGFSVAHRVHSRSSVTFSFELPEAAGVQLRVYNLAGKEVARLENGRLSPGRHQLNWSAGGMASGVYIYRLNAGGRTLSGRLRI
jgi:hypothetical protein